jgi:hypothetical protein
VSCGYGLQWHALPCGTESPSATTDQPRDVEQAIAKQPIAIKAAVAKPNRADHLTQRIVAGPRAHLHERAQGYVRAIKDGVAVRLRWLQSHAEALEAAGPGRRKSASSGDS